MAFTRKCKPGGLLLPVLIAVVILFAITPASAFTATLNTPTSIQPGDLISISIAGLADKDSFRVEISSTNLVNTANSYRLESFSMPFGFQHGTSALTANGTNVKQLNMHVKTATDEVTYTKTGGPLLNVTSDNDVHKEVYTIIEFSGIPYTAGSTVGVSLVAQGKVSGTELPDPGKPANLNFTLQGASSGSIRVQIPGATPPLDATFTVTTPPNFVASDTKQTPEIPSGGTAPLDYPATGTSLGITAKQTDTIDAGTSVTVTQYDDAPTDLVTPPSTSTYKALGKYVDIVSSDPGLSSKIAFIVINIGYDPADIPAGVHEADLKVYYYNPATGAWDPLPGYPTDGNTVDTNNHICIGKSTHLSVYGILAVIPPPPPPGGGGGGGGGSYFPMPETMVAPYKGVVAKVTATVPATQAPEVPVAEVTTVPTTPPAVKAGPAETATTPSKTPSTPLPGILGLIIAAGIFIGLRRH